MVDGRVVRRRRPEVQLALPKTAGWGGRRKGAGRKRKEGSGVSHARRERFRNQPVHVTMKVLPEIVSLRSPACFAAILACLLTAREAFGARICHFNILGNHLHFVVEGLDEKALSRAMQSLTIRLAKAINRVMKRKGRVFADRYHAHVLRTPTEVKNAVDYVLDNVTLHILRAAEAAKPGARRRGAKALRVPPGTPVDRFCSSAHLACVVAPTTYLLRRNSRAR